MNHTYADRKRTQPDVRDKETAEQSFSMEALRSGAAQPTAEQMGHRVDLPDAMREKMESAFGADLSAVKLYESQTVADAGAKAVTQGANIAFAPGMLDFSSFGGQALLGHELSHVVTQARGEVTGSGYLNDVGLEARADREGAMAAAGQSVAMPTAALSPVSAAAADGPMQAARDKKTPRGMPPKPQTPAPPPPAPVPPLAAPKQDFSAPMGKVASLASGKSLKTRQSATSVLSTDTVQGDKAIVKLGANPQFESAAADMINVGGHTMNDLYGGSWDMDAPSARAPLMEEEAELKDAIHRKEMLGFDFDQYKAGSTEEEKEAQEFENTTVFPMVKGLNRLDPEYGPDVRKANEQRARGLKPVDSTPDNPTEKSDYFRTMGHVAMMDLLLGNEDRLLVDENFENWLEDTDTRQVHLIDNDGANRGMSMVHAGNAVGRKQWLSWMSGFIGDKGDIDKGASNIYRRMRSNVESSARFTGVETRNGIAEAARALPEMRERLQAQFRQQTPVGPMTAYQQEALDRMEITHEAMTDPQMARVYRVHGTGGMPDIEGETQADADKRKELLEERDRLRRLKDKRSRGVRDVSLD